MKGKNRGYLFLLIVLVLLLVILVTNCATPAAETPPEPAPTAPPAQEPAPEPEPVPVPAVIEKDVELGPWPGVWGKEILETAIVDSYLTFFLVPGNRVEGEVSTTDPGSTFCRIIDPYGNRILETRYSHKTELSTQDYPWKFAFIAATSGEYTLQVDTGIWILQGSVPHAHILIYIYER